jgi:Asp-tRNA(Asn)/Glu-tRNA(Gln) amidotransferase A subunit family amidase
VNADLLAAPSTDGVRTIVAATTSGERRCEEVVRACLERIAEVEDDLLAWAYVDPDLALDRARALDRLPPDQHGPLHGVPVGIKDIVDTADQPTEHGSPIYAGHRPDRDAPVVARLQAAGAVVVGKTVTTEFALFHPGPTRNPHDPSRTPGGSSSGSAAAVGAGCVPLAIGTQTAGSVVRPASFCGVVGVKPTFGVLPTEGVKPCSDTLDTVGVLTRDVEDAAVALGVLADDPAAFELAPTSDRPRLGFVRTAQWELVPAGVQRTIEAAVDRIGRDTDVVEVTLPPEYDGLLDAQMTIMGVEAARLLAPERREHPDLLSDQVRAYLDQGASLRGGYDEALALTERCRARLDEVLGRLDGVIAPAVLDEAPPVATTGDPILCRMWTLLGTPTVAVPGLKGARGLPLGLQVVGAPHRDDVVLGVASWVARRLGDT